MVGGRHTLSARGRFRGRDRATRSTSLWLLAGGIVVVAALIALFAIRGTRILALRNQLSSSLLGVDAAMVERQDLENQLAQKDNLKAIEDAAREQLGWVRPGEERVIFVDWTEESTGEGE